MSSEALLENPSLFSNLATDQDELALEYIDFSLQYNPNNKYIKSHLFKMLY
jgi:tRNA-dihydrouridine synthase 4